MSARMLTERVALALLLTSCASCINVDLSFYETELQASLVYPAPVTDPVTLHVEVHHARSGGKLSHPLGLIDAFEVEPDTGAPASFERTLLVPTDADDGEGMVVYAWLDLDGDGVLCGLDGGGVDEPAGLLELDAFPAHEIEFELTLDAVCVGPEGLYP